MIATCSLSPVRQEEVVGNRNSILVVDDEEMICSIAKRILARTGYNVLTATSGREGLELFTRQSDSTVLVLLDMVMDGMSGIETLHRIREIDSDMPCIFSSGRIIDMEDLPSDLQNGVRFLEKPYRSSELSDMVSSMLATVADTV